MILGPEEPTSFLAYDDFLEIQPMTVIPRLVHIEQ